MQRLIKFRAWNENEGRFLDNEEITNTLISVHNEDGSQRKIQPLANIILYNIDIGFKFQQFTGLLDKNGKEIYEGDIVSYEAGEPNRNDMGFYKSKSEVKFKNGAFWPRPVKEECEDSWYDYELKNLEIIGNIFETPELLK